MLFTTGSSEKASYAYELGQIQKMGNLFRSSIDQLSSTYRTWKKDSDARITVFAKCANVLRVTQLAIAYIQVLLFNKEWWQAVAGKDIPDEDIQHFGKEFDTFVRIGFLQLLFSSVESSFRLIL